MQKSDFFGLLVTPYSISSIFFLYKLQIGILAIICIEQKCEKCKGEGAVRRRRQRRRGLRTPSSVPGVVSLTNVAEHVELDVGVVSPQDAIDTITQVLQQDPEA